MCRYRLLFSKAYTQGFFRWAGQTHDVRMMTRAPLVNSVLFIVQENYCRMEEGKIKFYGDDLKRETTFDLSQVPSSTGLEGEPLVRFGRRCSFLFFDVCGVCTSSLATRSLPCSEIQHEIKFAHYSTHSLTWHSVSLQ